MKSTGVAFIFWFFGLHYFYLNKPKLGVLYLLTLGGFGLWTIIDLFRLSSLVRQANESQKTIPVMPAKRPLGDRKELSKSDSTISVDTKNEKANAYTFTVSVGHSVNYAAPTDAEAYAESEACWLAPGSSIKVAGIQIPGGMIYVGEKLRAIEGWKNDAALIDPTKPVDRNNVDRDGRSMSYWPSYSEIDPGCRAAYLEWLADGRRNPEAYIGYVFLWPFRHSSGECAL